MARCCQAQPSPTLITDDLNKLRTEIQKEISALKKQEAKLHQQFLDLDRKSKLLDRKSELLDEQLRTLRATGAGEHRRCAGRSGSAGYTRDNLQRADGKLASRLRPALRWRKRPLRRRPLQRRPGASPRPRRRRGESAPIQGPSAAQQQARQVVETAPSLSTAGGVLTPKGQFVLDPSIEYDYWSQNQLGVNGFQIIPGITFGNIFANRVEQNITTAAADRPIRHNRSLGGQCQSPLCIQYWPDDQPDPGWRKCRSC